MNWQFWTGTAIFAATFGGMLWLRSRPPGTRPRPVTVTVARTRRVLATLRRHGRLIGVELRESVQLRPAEFYELMDQLKRRQLVDEVAVSWPSTLPLWQLTGYELTDDGRAALDRYGS